MAVEKKGREFWLALVQKYALALQDVPNEGQGDVPGGCAAEWQGTAVCPEKTARQGNVPAGCATELAATGVCPEKSL